MNFFRYQKKTFTFITNFNNTTYEYYLKQPNWMMLEWRIIENLARNSKLIKAFDRILSHPLIRKYSNVNPLANEGES